MADNYKYEIDSYGRIISPENVIRWEDALSFSRVFYPGKHGVFCAFAETRGAEGFFCSCTKSLVWSLEKFEGQLRNFNLSDLSNPIWSRRRIPVPSFELSRFFPSEFSDELTRKEPLSDQLRFRPRLCHKCNLAPPSLQYCDKDYGGAFVSRFGWYVNQLYLSLGIFPIRLGAFPARFTFFLSIQADRPRELSDLLLQHSKVQERYVQAHDELFTFAARNCSPSGEEEFVAALSGLNHLAGKICSAVENLCRLSFGFKKIGDYWVSETILAQMVEILFPGEKILRHAHPDWLDGLELDIYLPNLKLAIEYQGKQHFRPVDFFGGEEGFRKLSVRDNEKLKTCETEGIDLVYVRYDDPLEEKFLRELLRNYL